MHTGADTDANARWLSLGRWLHLKNGPAATTQRTHAHTMSARARTHKHRQQQQPRLNEHERRSCSAVRHCMTQERHNMHASARARAGGAVQCHHDQVFGELHSRCERTSFGICASTKFVAVPTVTEPRSSPRGSLAGCLPLLLCCPFDPSPPAVPSVPSVVRGTRESLKWVTVVRQRLRAARLARGASRTATERRTADVTDLSGTRNQSNTHTHTEHIRSSSARCRRGSRHSPFVDIQCTLPASGRRATAGRTAAAAATSSSSRGHAHSVRDVNTRRHGRGGEHGAPCDQRIFDHKPNPAAAAVVASVCRRKRAMQASMD